MKKADREILEDLNKKFQSAIDNQVWKDWRKHAIRDFEFKEGNQWTAAEIAELRARKQPDTVENQIKVVCDRLMGQYRKAKARIGYRGRNQQDQALGHSLTALSLYIHQHNQYNYEEAEMFDDGITSGFGCLEMYVEYDDQEKPQIKVDYEDCLNIYPDPHSKRYNWNKDAIHISRAKWMDLSEAESIYPEHKTALKSIVGFDPAEEDGTSFFKKDNFYDDQTKRVRLVEMQYKKRKKIRKVLTPDGQVIDLTGLKGKKLKDTESLGRVRERVKTVMYFAVFCGDILLEHMESPHDFTQFTFTPYFCYRKKNGEPYSPVRLIIDPQMEINKRRSKALHLLTLNQSIYETGTINDKDNLALEMAKPDGQIELNRGGMERFRIEKNNELASTQMSLHAESKQAIRDITGINPESGGGGRSEVRSGIGIARKQEVTNEITFPIFDNLKRTREILAKLQFKFIKQYFTEEMVFTITDDLGMAQEYAVNNTPENAIKEGTFDVVVDDLPDTTTIQQEQLNIVSQALPQFLKYGPQGAALLIQMSDLKNKDELLKLVQGMGKPQPPEAKVSITFDWADLGPEEKMALAGGKLGMPQLAQAIQQRPAPSKTDKKLLADAQKTQIKAQTAEGATASKERIAGSDRQHDEDKSTAEIIFKGMESVQNNTNTTQ